MEFIDEKRLLDITDEIQEFISKKYKLTEFEMKIVLQTLLDRLRTMQFAKKQKGLLGGAIRQAKAAVGLE